MRYRTAEMERADALLFGRVTYEMMESAWRRPATGAGPTLLAGLRERIELELVDRQEFRSGAVALRCRPRREPGRAQLDHTSEQDMPGIRVRPAHVLLTRLAQRSSAGE